MSSTADTSATAGSSSRSDTVPTNDNDNDTAPVAVAVAVVVAAEPAQTATFSQWRMNQKVTGGGNTSTTASSTTTTKKSVWARTLETFRMSNNGGKTMKTDLLVPADDMAEALRQLTLMIPDNEEEEEEETNETTTAGATTATTTTTTTTTTKTNKWDLDLTEPLLVELQKTKYDLYRAFLKWARIEPNIDDNDNDNDAKEGGGDAHADINNGKVMMNVTKAFRRLESYVTWMEDNRKDLELPITIDSIGPAAKAWACRCNYSSVTPAQPQQRFVWFMDFGAMDIPAIQKTISHADSLRYIVFLSHVVMLDEVAQDNGMVFVESMSHKGMWESFTMVPMEIGTKTDRLTIGTLPIKMKACYIVHGAKWIRILMGLMKPLMSAKMRQRIIVVNDNVKKGPSPQDVLDAQVGRRAIPIGFAGLEGSAETDILFGKYLKE